VDFFHGGTRGFTQERRPPRSVTLKLHPDVDELEPSSVPLPIVSADAPMNTALIELKSKVG
jgi:hypothetical protein